MPTSKPKKLLITGPESSGKSSLAMDLAHKLRCNVVPEYARIYLGRLDQDYSANDLEIILAGQMRAESLAEQTSSSWLICDTGPLVMYIWSTEVFGSASESIVAALGHLKEYHSIFLCYPDIPWEPDQLRENPTDRDRLFERYKGMLETLELDYHVIRGVDRTEQALKCIL